MRKRITSDVLNEVKTRYNNGETLTDICNDLGHCRKHMSTLLKNKGFKFKTRTYSLNENYFNNIDTADKAYWLGFISGDGTVDKSLSFIRIKLSSKDKDHLEKLKRSLSTNTKIKTKYNKTNFGKKEMSLINICSKVMCEDLVKLGCIPNKSLSLEFPLIEKKYQLDYIRGLIDANGYISYDKSTSGTMRPTLGLVGNKSMIHSVRDILEQNGIYNTKVRQDPRRDNCWELRVRKYSEVVKAYNRIYLGSQTYLTRKRNKLSHLIKEASTTIIAPSFISKDDGIVSSYMKV